MAENDNNEFELVSEVNDPPVQETEHVPGINMAKSPEPVKIEDVPDMSELDRELIEAEQKRGIAMMKANADYQKTLDKINGKKADVLGTIGTEAYGVKEWAGHVIFQCLYCPLDVPANEEERMIDHVNAAHPAPRGLPTYDNLGNAIVTVKESE